MAEPGPEANESEHAQDHRRGAQVDHSSLLSSSSILVNCACRESSCDSSTTFDSSARTVSITQPFPRRSIVYAFTVRAFLAIVGIFVLVMLSLLAFPRQCLPQNSLAQPSRRCLPQPSQAQTRDEIRAPRRVLRISSRTCSSSSCSVARVSAAAWRRLLRNAILAAFRDLLGPALSAPHVVEIGRASCRERV